MFLVFSRAIQYFFETKNINDNFIFLQDLKNLNSEIFFKNNLNLFASACYIVSYNFYDEFSQESSISFLGETFNKFIEESLFKENELEDLNINSEYESEIYGDNYYDIYENNIERFHFEYEQKKLWIKKIIERNVEDMKGFIKESKRFKRAENANKENQYRILSFPWCIAGKLLSTMKFLN